MPECNRGYKIKHYSVTPTNIFITVNYLYVQKLKVLAIIPAIVESLHCECFEQFALNDARAAFLLADCGYKHKSL